MSNSCGNANRPSVQPCRIKAEVKNRNGQPRWWCLEHGAPAWGVGGVPLDRCRGADTPEPDPGDVLRIDPSKFPGGVAVWGAVDPVFNTGPDPTDWGVHVHARTRPGGSKAVDQTYSRVILEGGDNEVTVDALCASAFVVASVFGLHLKRLVCPHCGGAHVDAEEFATSAHRKHQCNQCGRHFFDPDNMPSISNPLAGLRTQFGEKASTTTPSHAVLDIEQSDFAGGIAVWGSNQALLWTADRQEEEGVHVHAWSERGDMVIDDTFDKVTIDGLELDPVQVRVLMVQQSLRFLRNRVIAFTCPDCNLPHFDSGVDALKPHSSHLCDGCGGVFHGRNRHRLLVSNPLIGVIRTLHRNRQPEA